MDPLGEIFPWIAAWGGLALVGAMAVERFIPILPSYALLVTIGIASGEGHWSLLTALPATIAGSVIGCLALYAMVLMLGERRSLAFVRRLGRMFGLSAERTDRWIAYFRARDRTLAFAAQLIPTVRMIAPGIAGLLRARPRAFTVGTVLGVTLWNGLFFGTGYVAAVATDTPNASEIAVGTLGIMTAALIATFLLWWALRLRRRTP